MSDIIPAAVVSALISSVTSLLILEAKTAIQRNIDKKEQYSLRLEKIYYPFYRTVIMYYDSENNEILHNKDKATDIIENVLFDNIQYLSTECQSEFCSFYSFYVSCVSKGKLTVNWRDIEDRFREIAIMILNEHKKISRKLKLEQPADIFH